MLPLVIITILLLLVMSHSLSTPTLISNYYSGGGTTYRDAAFSSNGEYAFLITPDLLVLDISDPSNMKLLGSYSISTTNYETISATSDGNTVYIADSTTGAGVHVFDVTNKAVPTLLTSCTTSATNWFFVTISPNNDYLFVTDHGAGKGVYIIDVSIRTSPSMIANYAKSGTVIYWSATVSPDGNFVYLPNKVMSAGFDIIDVTVKSSPTFVANWAGSGQLWDYITLAPNGNIAYVNDANGEGVHCINVEVKNSPSQLTFFSSGNIEYYGPAAISPNGEFLYVALMTGGMQILNVTAKSSTPTLLYTYSVGVTSYSSVGLSPTANVVLLTDSGSGKGFSALNIEQCSSNSTCAALSSTMYCNTTLQVCIQTYANDENAGTSIISNSSTIVSTSTSVNNFAVPTSTYGNLAIQIVSPGSSSALTRSLYINMFIYLRYLEVNYPDDLLQIFKDSEPAELAFPIPFPSSWSESADEYVPPDRYAAYDVHGLLLQNFWKIFCTFAIIGSISALLRLLEMMEHKIVSIYLQKIFKFFAELFVWSFLLFYFIESAAEASFFMIVEYQSLQVGKSVSVMVPSVIINILSLFTIIFVWTQLLIPRTLAIYNELQTNISEENLDKNLLRFKILYKDCKIQTKREMAFLFIFSNRITLFNMVVTLLFSQPILQIIILVCLNIAMLIYLFKVQPFRKRMKQIEQIFYESCLLIVNMMVLIYAALYNQGGSNLSLTNGILLMDMILMIGSIYFTITEFISMMREAWEAASIHFKKHKKVVPLSKNVPASLEDVSKNSSSSEHNQNFNDNSKTYRPLMKLDDLKLSSMSSIVLVDSPRQIDLALSPKVSIDQSQSPQSIEGPAEPTLHIPSRFSEIKSKNPKLKKITQETSDIENVPIK